MYGMYRLFVMYVLIYVFKSIVDFFERKDLTIIQNIIFVTDLLKMKIFPSFFIATFLVSCAKGASVRATGLNDPGNTRELQVSAGDFMSLIDAILIFLGINPAEWINVAVTYVDDSIVTYDLKIEMKKNFCIT